MKHTFIFMALIGVVFANLHAQQVTVTFKTVADGEETIDGDTINVPNYTLTGGGGDF